LAHAAGTTVPSQWHSCANSVAQDPGYDVRKRHP